MRAARLEADGLHVAYGSRTVVPGLRLAPADPGCVIGVLGPNGVGKSTLLRAMARLVPARGTLRLGEVDLLHCSRAQLLGQVGYLPQSLPQACSLRVLEAVVGALRATCPGLSAQEHQARVHDTLAELSLYPLAMRRLDQLSGGQRQMVGLAQVLVRRTPLLLLDEPTSALDLRWQVLALEAVRHAAQARGTIVCMAMHDLNLASRFCDRLLLLGPAGLLADGPPAQVLSAELLREAFQVQASVQRTAAHDAVVLVERALAANPS